MIKLILYVILLLVLVYVAIIYNSISLIFLVGVGFTLPLFLVAILIYQCISLKLSFGDGRQYLEPGENAGVRLQVLNQSIFPVKQLAIKMTMKNITTGEIRNQWVKTSVGKKKETLFIQHHDSDKKSYTDGRLSYGIWLVSCEKIRIYDIMSWFSFRKWAIVRGEVVQIPRRYEVNLRKSRLDSNVSMEVEEYEPGVRGSDASHLKEIREYQPGDRQKDIHWKLTAKKEQLMVKEYGQPVGSELGFGLDLEKLNDTALEVIYSLLAGCVEKHIRVSLFWKGRTERQPIQCMIQQEGDVYDALERIMKDSVTRWKSEETAEVGIGRQLWLKDRKLYLDGHEVGDFSQGEPAERLLDMELVL